jgi:hypothetical protein
MKQMALHLLVQTFFLPKALFWDSLLLQNLFTQNSDVLVYEQRLVMD